MLIKQSSSSDDNIKNNFDHMTINNVHDLKEKGNILHYNNCLIVSSKNGTKKLKKRMVQKLLILLAVPA